MKKTLAAIAVLGAFAGSAVAADVTLYGKIDTGFAYTRTDTGAGSSDKFEMKTGNNSGNRWGLKGTEDLGNGLKVGFVLENGFDADTGALGNGDRLFGREAQINLSGSFGTVAFGRMGELASGNGSFGILGSNASAIGTGWASAAGVGHNAVFAAASDRYDNTITYKSPAMAGLTVYAQYSMDTNTLAKWDDGKTVTEIKVDGKDKYSSSTSHDGTEGESSVDRFYAIGATYANGPVAAGLIVDSTNERSVKVKFNKDTSVVTKKAAYDNDDPIKVSAFGSYDFGVAKVLVAAQYFQDAKLKTAAINKTVADGYGKNTFDGFGLNVGATIPACGGVAKVAVGYMDAEESAATAKEITRYTATAVYEYSLSKRTSVYGGVSYVGDDYGNYGKEANQVGAAVGLIHNF